nr:hypothetical protein [Tanacetum cinerariifolium]
MKANDDKINNMEIKFDQFQKQCEQIQDDLLNQIRNFMPNFQNVPLGVDKEHEATTDTELPSTKDIQPLPIQEPPYNSDICQLIREECSIEVPEEQKQSMEDTMLELIKICQEKEFLCIHDDVDDLIESALNSKLLLINSNSQHLDKKEQEVKNVVEQRAERGNHSIPSLQNFKVVHKSSISSDTSQISSIHSIAPILSTKEPEHSLSMGYEHLSITPETESDKVTESNAENLLPILSECKVALEDKRECTVPISENFPDCDNHSEILFDLNNDDLSSDGKSFKDIEYVDASVLDLAIISVEEENVVHREEEEVDFEDISQIQDVVLREKLLSITRLISNIESLNNNPTHDQPPDDNFDLVTEAISAVMEDIDEPDEHLNPGGEIFVSTNNEDVDNFPFMFVIQIFLPYLILPEISPLFLSTESEDMIFDPGLSSKIEDFLCRILSWFSKTFISFDRF